MLVKTHSTPKLNKILLTDYQKPTWQVKAISLEFDLNLHATKVTSKIDFSAHDTIGDLTLHGHHMTLISAKINGKDLDQSQFITGEETLIIPKELLPGTHFTWECVTEINPKDNTSLEGLY